MAIKIKDPKDPSKEIEVYTKDELDSAKKDATDTAAAAASKAAKDAADAAIETYKQSNPDRTDEISKLKDDLAEAQAALEQAQDYGKNGNEGGDRDKQVERLRKERDEKVGELSKKVEELTGTIETMNKSQFEGLKNELLDEYAGTDPEMRKKVEFEFDNYRASETGIKAMTERMEKAAQLAGVDVDERPDAMDGARGHGGAKGEGEYGGKSTTVTTNAVAIGKALGVTEDELKEAAAKNGGDKK